MPSSAHNVSELLRARAAATPDAPAVHFPSGKRPGSGWSTATFSDLDRRANAVARGLTSAGLRPGDRAVLLLRPTLDFYPLVFGMFRAGVVPVFIDPGMGRAMALGCVAQVAPRGLIGLTAAHAASFVFRAPFRSVEVRVTAGPRLLWGGPTLADCLSGDASALDAAPVEPDDDAVLVFTSGSTGAPKAVSLSHRCMTARVRLIQEMLDLRPGAVISETLLVYTILEVCMGMTVVIPPMDLARPATVDPSEVVRTVRQWSPTIASASPVVWQRLVRHCIDRNERLDGLRMLLTTAAPIPVDLHARLSQVVPADTELFTPYGATEAMPVAVIGTREVLTDAAARTARGAGTCVGAPAPGIDIRIIRVSDDPIPTWSDALALPDGQIGEIVVAGDGVSRAYRESPKGDAMAKIADGDRILHRMGDLGWRDERGRLWFAGRAAHRLRTASGMVPNVPVEGIFNQHDAVYRSALVGVGTPERAVLCVELEPGRAMSPALEAEILALAEGTPYAGLVDRVLVHPGFPTDTRHNSKIRNEDLRAWVAAR